MYQVGVRVVSVVRRIFEYSNFQNIQIVVADRFGLGESLDPKVTVPTSRAVVMTNNDKRQEQ